MTLSPTDSSLHKEIAFATLVKSHTLLLQYMKNDQGKGKAYPFIAQSGRFILQYGAASEVLTVHAGTCTVNI
jgi:hypothetical protein